ncbi:DinB family protein [Bacillus sp. JJ1609]|uniref:DinB family protein n=1 Tax=Bacillus sp. JJ1609 TaxID=3122977 RepID=UPI0030009131
MGKREALYVSSLPGYDAEIGRWIWCLEEVRNQLIAKLSGISQELLDKKLEDRQSIGTLLYHIAFVEAGWLFGEVLEKEEWDPEISALFPVEGWTNGKLTHFEGERIEEHFSRLKKVREVFLSVFKAMTKEDWRKARVLEEYDVTPEWVVYHLIDHESHHRGQIFQMLRGLKSN